MKGKRETVDDGHKHIVGMLHTPPYGDLVRTGDKIPNGANFIEFAYCPQCGRFLLDDE